MVLEHLLPFLDPRLELLQNDLDGLFIRDDFGGIDVFVLCDLPDLVFVVEGLGPIEEQHATRRLHARLLDLGLLALRYLSERLLQLRLGSTCPSSRVRRAVSLLPNFLLIIHHSKKLSNMNIYQSKFRFNQCKLSN